MTPPAPATDEEVAFLRHALPGDCVPIAQVHAVLRRLELAEAALDSARVRLDDRDTPVWVGFAR